MLYTNRQHELMLTQQQRNNRRKRANPHQLAFLRKRFAEDPKPDHSARELIGRQIDMTPRSVQIWFQNNRAKTRIQEKRLAALYRVPIRTSSCGENISRVHFDLASSSKEYYGQFYPNSFFSSSEPALIKSEPEEFHYEDQDVSSFLFPERSDSSEFLSPAPDPEYQDFNSIFYDGQSEFDDFAECESNLLEARCDFEDVADPFQETETRPYSRFNDIGTLNDSRLDLSNVARFSLWGAKIGLWEYTCKNLSASYLIYSYHQQKVRVFFNNSSSTLALNANRQFKDNGFIVMDCVIKQLSKPTSQIMQLEVAQLPLFYFQDSHGRSELCDSDFTNYEIYHTNEYIFYGNFYNLEIEPQNSRSAHKIASRSVVHPRTSRDSLEVLLMDN